MSQSNDHQVLHPMRIEIPLDIRLYVIQLLNQTLACTVDLRSQVKQACWNVKGHDFSQLHALFATMATEFDAYTDLIAARIVVLGGVAQGTARTATAQSTLPEYPGAIMHGPAHVRALAEHFAPYATALREPLPAPRRSRMRAVRRSTRTSRAGSTNNSGSWKRTSTATG